MCSDLSRSNSRANQRRLRARGWDRPKPSTLSRPGPGRENHSTERKLEEIDADQSVSDADQLCRSMPRARFRAPWGRHHVAHERYRSADLFRDRPADGGAGAARAVALVSCVASLFEGGGCPSSRSRKAREPIPRNKSTPVDIESRVRTAVASNASLTLKAINDERRLNAQIISYRMAATPPWFPSRNRKPDSSCIQVWISL
jgi:hypothetical protein